MTTATLRRFELRDMRRVLRIERASFGVDAWPAELFREYARDSSCHFVVVQMGRGIAAYSILCVRGGAAEVASLAVLPRYRGRGLATLLLNAAIKKARRSGVTTVRLMVRRDNLGAIELYRKLGFTRTATVAGYYEDGATGWRMRLTLTAT